MWRLRLDQNGTGESQRHRGRLLHILASSAGRSSSWGHFSAYCLPAGGLRSLSRDRTHMTVDLAAEGEETAVAVEVYPLNAIGQKLMFGARKGVPKTVASWFFAHLEHRLPT